jgi:hypothetical protein
MEFSDIHIGMKCASNKGCGTVTWIDSSTRRVYLSDIQNNQCFDVSFEDIVEDPQAHNEDDTYY